METPQQGRVIAVTLLMLSGFGAGLAAGYYIWAGNQVAQTPVDPAPDIGTVESATKPVTGEPASPFSRLEAEIIGEISARHYARALALLIELDLLAVTAVELAQVSRLLEETVNLRVVQLEARQRFADIDALYESLTFAMPERAEYYLLLAEHRIRMGAPAAALPALAQIENHHQLGGRARDLISSLAPDLEVPVLAAVPLIKRGDQYLVRVMVDEAIEATLMLDTGASMTVLSPALLRRLNYGLKGNSASFSTAGGIVSAPVVNIESLAVGGANVGSLAVGALVLGGEPEQVDGLLGMDYLAQFEFTLDQDQGVLNLISRRR